MRQTVRTTARFATITGAGTALLCSAATALATPTPVALGVNQGVSPEVAYDPVSGVSFVAWSDDTAPGTGIDLCVLPRGGSECAGNGPVLLSVSGRQNPDITGTDTISLGALTVLPGGDVVVIGTPVTHGSIAWESPANGSSFLTSGQGLENGGGSVSPVSLLHTSDDAIGLSPTDVELLDGSGDRVSDSTVAGPESPPIDGVSYADSSENVNQDNGDLFHGSAGVSGLDLAGEPAPAPAPLGSEIVVGVGDNNSTDITGPPLPGCVDSSGTGFGVSVGTVDGQSDAFGTLNRVGLPRYGLLACAAQNPVLASGGEDGIGVLENEAGGDSDDGDVQTLDYRPFSATATGGSFGAPVQVANLNPAGAGPAGENDPGPAGNLDVIDDSGSGVYAMWDSLSTGGLTLNYSADGGATWGVPAGIPNPPGGFIGDPEIAGVGGGNVVLAYIDTTGVGRREATFATTLNYARLRSAVSAVDAGAVVPDTASATASAVTLAILCSVTPCTVTATITVPATGTATAARRAKPITLGTARFTITQGRERSHRLNWNATGRRLIRTHTALGTTLSLSTKTARGIVRSSHRLRITRR